MMEFQQDVSGSSMVIESLKALAFQQDVGQSLVVDKYSI